MNRIVLATILALLSETGVAVSQQLPSAVLPPPSSTTPIGQSPNTPSLGVQLPANTSISVQQFPGHAVPIAGSVIPESKPATGNHTEQTSVPEDLTLPTPQELHGGIPGTSKPSPLEAPPLPSEMLPGIGSVEGAALPTQQPSLWSGSPPPPAASYRAWMGTEALLWWERKEPLPSNLVTTGLPTDTVPGALGQPNTLVLSSPSNINYGAMGGVRAFIGGWLDPQQIIGLEASGFVLQKVGQSFNFGSTSGGNPLLALRYLGVPNGVQNAFVIASPSSSGATVGPLAGAITVETNSQLWGADVNVLHALGWTRHFYLVGLVGLRYLDLNESAAILTRRAANGSAPLTFLNQPFASPAFELTDDQFGARNHFFGGQLGLRGDYYFGHFFVGVSGKVALGETDEVANILGITTIQPHNRHPLTSTGGLYALPSNSGRTTNQDFGVVPELQLKGGILLTRWLRATLGYDFLYWSHVMRVGNLIDLNVDARQVPTSPTYQVNAPAHSPMPTGNPSNFWAQGLTFGLEFTY